MDQWTRRATIVLAFVIVGAFLVASGCSKKPRPTKDITQDPGTTEQQTGDPRATEGQTGDQTDNQTDKTPAEVILTDVFFDYDRYNLRDEARRTLEQNARMLLNDRGLHLVLEGHCDERGTVEYNLALGERRAQSVRTFLVEYGVAGERLSAISYGEERPFAFGHEESAWSQNRRVHFVKQ